MAGVGAGIFLVMLAGALAYAWHRAAWLSEAASEQTPPARLAAIAEQLSSDPDPSIRIWVPMNPGLSRETLARLAADADPSVRNHASALLRRRVR